MIAVRAENEPNRNDEGNSPASSEQDQDGYEVRRAIPKNGDSFVGGLDILTVHRMISAEQMKQDGENRESAQAGIPGPGGDGA